MTAIRILVPALAAACLAGADQTTPRIIGADAVQRSAKRGVCMNRMAEADFRVLAPAVSWYYNWHFTTEHQAPPELGFTYIPMVWGDRPESYNGLEQYLAAGNKPQAVFAINEPNLKGQAFITPEVCAKAMLATQAIAAKHGIPVVGPHMALGSAPNDSITAMDPIEQKQVTYSWFVPYLKAMAHYTGGLKGVQLGVHAYKDLGEVTWSINASYELSGAPVWMTEFARWDANPKDMLTFLIQSVDLMERDPRVAGYAWFKERADYERIALLGKEPGSLTTLGHAYLGMPVYDPATYYRVPGRIEAERRTASDAKITATGDADGLADLLLPEDAYFELHIAPEHPGAIQLTARLSGPGGGSLACTIDGKAVGSIAIPEGTGWRDAAGTAVLPAGPLRLRLTATGTSARVNWIDFKR